MRLATKPRRRATTLVETAVVQSVLFLFLFGVLVGGLGIFNYQEVAWLSREASREVSVRGSQYAKETGKPSPSASVIRNTIVLPLAAAMDPQQLTVEVFLVNGVTGTVTDWDSSDKAPATLDNTGRSVANAVRVRVTYRWTSPIFFAGPLNLQSTSETPMAF